MYLYKIAMTKYHVSINGKYIILLIYGFRQSIFQNGNCRLHNTYYSPIFWVFFDGFIINSVLKAACDFLIRICLTKFCWLFRS